MTHSAERGLGGRCQPRCLESERVLHAPAASKPPASISGRNSRSLSDLSTPPLSKLSFSHFFFLLFLHLLIFLILILGAGLRKALKRAMRRLEKERQGFLLKPALPGSHACAAARLNRRAWSQHGAGGTGSTDRLRAGTTCGHTHIRHRCVTIQKAPSSIGSRLWRLRPCLELVSAPM